MEIAISIFKDFDPTDDRPLVIAELSGNHNKSLEEYETIDSSRLRS